MKTLARRGAGGVAAVRHRSACAPWRSGRTLAATFPLRFGSSLGPMASMISRSCASATAVTSQRFEGGEHRFEIDELGPRHHPLPQQRRDGSARFLRDGDRLYVLHRGVTARGSRSHAGRAGRRRKQRRRRQGARGDERPRGRGAGQSGRACRRRPAGDDAGSDEDGTCARGRRSQAWFPRSMSRKASRSRPGRSWSRLRGANRPGRNHSHRQRAKLTIRQPSSPPSVCVPAFAGTTVVYPGRPVPSLSQHAT